MSSPHSASGYYTIYGEESLQADHFNTRLSFGEPHTLWARTGYLGFIKRTELLDASGGERKQLQWEELLVRLRLDSGDVPLKINWTPRNSLALCLQPPNDFFSLTFPLKLMLFFCIFHLFSLEDFNKPASGGRSQHLAEVIVTNLAEVPFVTSQMTLKCG